MDYLQDNNSARMYLETIFPGDKSRVNVMMLAYTDGIVDAIKNAVISKEWLQQESKEFASMYGLKDDVANMAVQTWAHFVPHDEMQSLLEEERIGQIYFLQYGCVRKCTGKNKRYLRFVSWCYGNDGLVWETNFNELINVIDEALGKIEYPFEIVLCKYFGLKDYDIESELLINAYMKAFPEEYTEAVQATSEDELDDNELDYFLRRARTKILHPLRSKNIRRSIRYIFKEREIGSDLQNTIKVDLNKFITKNKEQQFYFQKLLNDLEIRYEMVNPDKISLDEFITVVRDRYVKFRSLSVAKSIVLQLREMGVETVTGFLKLSEKELEQYEENNSRPYLSTLRKTISDGKWVINENKIIKMIGRIGGVKIDESFYPPLEKSEACEFIYKKLLETDAFFSGASCLCDITDDLRIYFMRMGYFYTKDLLEDKNVILQRTRDIFPQYYDRVANLFIPKTIILDGNKVGCALLDTLENKQLSLADIKIAESEDYYHYLHYCVLMYTSEHTVEVLASDDIIERAFVSSCDKYHKDAPLDQLDLGVRQYNCLKKSGINTLYELTFILPEGIHYIKHLGRKNEHDVMCQMKRYGLDAIYKEMPTDDAEKCKERRALLRKIAIANDIAITLPECPRTCGEDCKRYEIEYAYLKMNLDLKENNGEYTRYTGIVLNMNNMDEK